MGWCREPYQAIIIALYGGFNLAIIMGLYRGAYQAIIIAMYGGLYLAVIMIW
jgi:hypothetical protein